MISKIGYLYILSTKNGRYYIGSTNNVTRRVDEHQAGKTKALKNILPVKLVFAQRFDSLIEARRIEYKLKKFKNRKIIERIIKDQKINIEA